MKVNFTVCYVKELHCIELFLKDHVALKTEVMILKIQLYYHRNKLHLKIYLFDIKQLF